MKTEPRLKFTDEERGDPALKKPVKKAEKAAKKADKTQSKIPKKTVKTKERVVDPKTGKVTMRLKFEEVDKKKPPSKLSHNIKAAPGRALKSQLHKEIRKSENDNVGVESAHKLEQAAETGGRMVQSSYCSHKLKPYRKAATAESKLKKANVNALYKKSLRDNPQLGSNPMSRWQQKRRIKKQYAAAKRAGHTAQTTQNTVRGAGKAVDTGKRAVAFVRRHNKAFLILIAIFLVLSILLSSFSSCSVLIEGTLSALTSSTYPSKESDMLAVEAYYASMEAALQSKLTNYETLNPGYDEYAYHLDTIAHDPHELAAYLSALYQEYTLSEVQDELQRIFDMQYTLTETVTVEVRYYDETVTDPETGESYTVSVAYNYYIMTVTLTNNWLTSAITVSLTAEQLEIYQVYSVTQGNIPLLFGGGSDYSGTSTDLSGVEFINGERPGNQAIVDIALSQAGNAGGYPYWSWYGFNSRVAWCACFVSWCINQAGSGEPAFAYCPFGITWFSEHGQWASRNYANIAPGDIVFFDWEGDGVSDHVGIVVGIDGTYLYTVEGNSGDAVKVRSYLLDSAYIQGYGLMNW